MRDSFLWREGSYGLVSRALSSGMGMSAWLDLCRVIY